MQQLLCSGDVNFAVLDSKVIAVNQQSRYGQSRNSQSRKLLAVSSAECTWCPMSQMNLWGDFDLDRRWMRKGRQR